MIVVDDHSSDGSVEWLQSFAASHENCITLLRCNSEQKGACHARNLGLQNVSSMYVKFLDSDDYLLPGSLDKQIAQAKEHAADACSVYGDVVWVNENGTTIQLPPKCRNVGKEANEIEQVILNAPLTAAPLHRTADVRRVGGFDPRVPRGQEYDLHVRMWLSGVKFDHHPGSVYCYRQHDGPRISSSDGEEHIVGARLEMLLRHVDLARERFGTPLSDSMRIALGRNLWRNGRRALQCGARNGAMRYFTEAKRLAGFRAVLGSPIYKLLCGCLGPQLTEYIVSIRHTS